MSETVLESSLVGFWNLLKSSGNNQVCQLNSLGSTGDFAFPYIKYSIDLL